MNVTIQGPPAFFVAWSCRRCGHTGGSARATIPVNGWTEPMMRELFVSLRRKLVKIHLKQGCVATVEDFIIERGAPPEKTVIGLV